MTSTEVKITDPRDIARWKAGHLVFFVQIQSLLAAIINFEADPSAEALDEISSILLGSGVMMQYAADFPSKDYDPVREDMAKIHPDFSGTFSVDHAVLMRYYPVLQTIGSYYPDEHRNFGECLEVVYKAHSFVCRHFAGDGGSLAQGNIIAWRDIATRLLARALRKAGIKNSILPEKYNLKKSA